MRSAPVRLAWAPKVLLAIRIWFTFLVIRARLRGGNLDRLVGRLARPRGGAPRIGHLDPRRLGRIVHRVLWVGPFEPRCIFTALVLFRLLCRQGDRAQLVIGLPSRAATKDAHAWVEIDGIDVGPPPGRGHNDVLVRYG